MKKQIVVINLRKNSGNESLEENDHVDNDIIDNDGIRYHK